ncbi:MAG: hypothetical protein A3C44_00570 [Gammaproteobacteria bacterium RIFCSPHIGHO2_02_FULL_39_13]|nr:MAG: hypothetical protein A3C44_00570 [Gammaproteobacteria bacterium RIFCSPHIGHO2_02_FULL_39_13]
MYVRKDIGFNTENSLTLRGWFYTPKTTPAPCIIMAHGFSALKEHYLDKFAARFAEAGMCVLVYDNRNFGDSDGESRLEVDPILQIRDMRSAITFAQQLLEVIPEKIGIWGTSFSGGVVLAVSAIDKRVSCVVSQVPFISGHHKSLRLERPEKWPDIRKKYDDERRSRLQGNAPTMIPVVSESSEKPGIMRQPDATAFFKSVKKWPNKVTLRSVENSGEFEPIGTIKQISPAPLLFLVADKDTVNTTDIAFKAFKKAREPKKFVLFSGDHFDPYINQFEICSSSACQWFEKFLLGKNIYANKKQERVRAMSKL